MFARGKWYFKYKISSNDADSFNSAGEKKTRNLLKCIQKSLASLNYEQRVANVKVQHGP